MVVACSCIQTRRGSRTAAKESTSHRTWQHAFLQAEPAVLMLYNNIAACHDTSVRMLALVCIYSG